jgi:hypothetical protein
MAQGMESDVSDDDSDSPLYEELLELVHEHQKKLLRSNQMKLKTLMLLMILMLFSLQIMKICHANSNYLAKSMKSSS